MLSVIVPVYNSETYLEECIKAILSQTYSDFELILVDDGSIDKSGEICDRYSVIDSRIIVIHQSNKGPSESRINGLKSSTGEFIAFVDSDDTIETTYLSELITPFFDDSRISVSVAGYSAVLEDGIIKKKIVSDYEGIMLPDKALIAMLLKEGFIWSLWGKIYRRNLLTDYERWPHSYGEDTFINWEVFQKASYVYYVKNTGYHYRAHSNNITSLGFSDAKEAYFTVWHKLLDDARKLEDNELLDAVRRHVVLEANVLMAEMYVEHPKFKEKIITKRSEILNKIDEEEYKQKCQNAYFLLTDPSSVCNEIEKLIIEINQNKDKKLYLYGAGYVAKDVLSFLKKNSCRITGVKVSHVTGNAMFEGYPVEKYESNADEEDVYIIAMNKKHTEEVINNINGSNYILAGWLSVNYYT